MKRKVRITRMPNLKSGAEVKLQGLRAGLGFNSNVMPWPIMAGKMSAPDVEVNSTLKPVPRDQANLEAEKGEVAMTPGAGGIPDTFKIGGKRHYEGGTPLNLPDDSFIFSDTAKMKIKDPVILAQFGMPEKKGGYTPADIAKKYNTAPYKKVLADPDSDDMQKHTAEIMIANYNLKLAKLALVQESMKGFPQGIPKIAMPYIEELQIDPSEFVQMNNGEASQEDDETSEGDNSTAAYGGVLQQLQARKHGGIFDQYEMAYGGLPKAQVGLQNQQQIVPGFSTLEGYDKANVANQAEFKRSSPENKIAYDEYVKALNSGKPWLMRQTANKLDKVDVPNSWGWLPWTQQDKYEDLSQILRDKAKTIDNPVVSKPTQFEKYDKKYNEIVAAYTKKRDRYSPSSLDYIVEDQNLKEILGWKQPNIPINQYEMYKLKEQPYIYPYDKIDKTYHELFAVPAKTAAKAPLVTKEVTTETQPTDSAYLPGKYVVAEKTTNATTGQPTTTKAVSTNKEKIAAQKIAAQKAAKLAEMQGKVGYKKQVGGELDTYAIGGSIDDEDDLLYAQKGKIVKYEEDPTGKTSYYRPVYDTGEFGDLEEFESEVSQEDADRLRKLYDEANVSKDQTKIQNFQREFHKTFPKYSRSVILSNKDAQGNFIPTNWALNQGLDPWDLEGNAEGLWGPRTKQYLAYLDKLRIKKKGQLPQEGTKEETKEGDKKSSDYKDEGLKYSHLNNVQYADQSAPEFKQDKLEQLRALNNYLNIKKYLPWQADIDYQLPNVAFADPTRELAANAELANIGAQGAAQFAGPQAYNARFAQIQGQDAKNAADIIGRYNNMNIGLANQQATNNAATMNRLNELKAKRTSDLYDKYNIVDQQFDTAKNNAVNQMFTAKIQAVNNAALAQAQNAMFDQYATDPSRGGTIYFKKNRSLTPSGKGEDPLLSAYDKLAKRFPTLATSDPYKLLNIASKMTTGKSVDDGESEYEKYAKLMEAQSRRT